MLFAILATKFRGRVNEQPENYGAIIAGDLDQVGLGDEPAEFDQLARAFAALHLPCPRVMSRPLRLKAIAGLRHSPVRRSCSGQRLYECGRRRHERRPRRSCATPPSG